MSNNPYIDAAIFAGVPLPVDPNNVVHADGIYHAVLICTFGIDLTVGQIAAVFGHYIALEQLEVQDSMSRTIQFAERLAAGLPGLAVA